MSLQIPLTPIRIKYRGMFDWQGLLRMMRQWFVDYDYGMHESGHEYKQGEFKVNWEATKNIHPFCQFRIEIFFHLREFQEVEVVKDGKKHGMQQARMLIEFRSAMILDYKNAFEKTRFRRFLFEFLTKYVLRRKIGGGWGDDLYYAVYKLHRATKEFLGMEAMTDSSRYRVI